MMQHMFTRTINFLKLYSRRYYLFEVNEELHFAVFLPERLSTVRCTVVVAVSFIKRGFQSSLEIFDKTASAAEDCAALVGNREKVGRVTELGTKCQVIK